MNTVDLTIRHAKTGDIVAIASLYGQLGYPTQKFDIKERFSKLIASEGHAVFVATLGNFGIIGWIHLMPRQLLYLPFNAEIGGIVVHTNHRNKGVGRALIKSAERWAKEHGYSNIVVRSDTARNASHPFYRAVGYSDLKTQNVYIKELGV